MIIGKNNVCRKISENTAQIIKINITQSIRKALIAKMNVSKKTNFIGFCRKNFAVIFPRKNFFPRVNHLL